MMTRAVPLVCAVVEKDAQEEVRVALDTHHDAHLVDIRIFAEFAGPCRVRGPTKKGVSIQVSKLPALLAALHDTLAEARRRGWLTEE